MERELIKNQGRNTQTLAVGHKEVSGVAKTADVIGRSGNTHELCMHVMHIFKIHYIKHPVKYPVAQEKPPQ